MSEVIINREDSVLQLKLNRPERRNALNYSLIDTLLDSLEGVSKDESCRVVVLSGEGSGFCAGDDLHGMGQTSSERWQGRKFGPAVLPQQALIKTLRTLPKPVVASIHGYALGIGLDLALASDIRICTYSTELGDPRVERALYAATGITYQLPRVIGYGRALGMMFMVDRIHGKEAERIGMVYKSVPENKLQSYTDEIVDKLNKSATKSIAVIKEQMRTQIDMSYESSAFHSISVRNSYVLEDQAEGIEAFLQKRVPKFKGK